MVVFVVVSMMIHLVGDEEIHGGRVAALVDRMMRLR
jgi:hypothetical protein